MKVFFSNPFIVAMQKILSKYYLANQPHALAIWSNFSIFEAKKRALENVALANSVQFQHRALGKFAIRHPKNKILAMVI